MSQSARYNGFMEAIVVEPADTLKEGRIAVVIPKIMPVLDPDSTEISKSPQVIMTTMFGNSDAPPITKVETSNAFWLRPAWPIYKEGGGQYIPPSKGSRVLCFFLDGDPGKGYYLPATLTRSGEATTGSNLVDESASTYASFLERHKVHILHETPNGAIIAFDFGGANPSVQVVLDQDNHVWIDKKKMVLKTPSLKAGDKGASEHMVLGDAFRGIYDSHMHPAAFGPTSAPLPPFLMIPGVHLSPSNYTK
jgi:hypothetical protein